jgi:hypothetical protein
MRTRSITRLLQELKQQYEVQKPTNNILEYEANINFDEASRAWKANKKSIGGGCYKYICEHQNKNCKRIPIPGCKFCSKHNI